VQHRIGLTEPGHPRFVAGTLVLLDNMAIHGWDPETGQKRWTTTVCPRAEWGSNIHRQTATFVLLSCPSSIPTSRPEYQAFDPTTGQQRWTRERRLSTAESTQQRGNDSIYLITMGGSVVVMGRADNREVWDATTGRTLWKVDAQNVSIAAGANAVFVGGSTVSARDPATGAVQWTIDRAGQRLDATPIGLYASGDPDGSLTKLDPASGSVLWTSPRVFEPASRGNLHWITDGPTGVVVVRNSVAVPEATASKESTPTPFAVLDPATGAPRSGFPATSPRDDPARVLPGSSGLLVWRPATSGTSWIVLHPQSDHARQVVVTDRALARYPDPADGSNSRGRPTSPAADLNYFAFLQPSDQLTPELVIESFE